MVKRALKIIVWSSTFQISRQKCLIWAENWLKSPTSVPDIELLYIVSFFDAKGLRSGINTVKIVYISSKYRLSPLLTYYMKESLLRKLTIYEIHFSRL